MYLPSAFLAVFRPIGLWQKRLAADSAPLDIAAMEDFCLKRLIQWQYTPPKPLAVHRVGDTLRTGMFLAVVQHEAVAAIVITAFAPYEGGCPPPLPRCHPGQRTVGIALYGR